MPQFTLWLEVLHRKQATWPQPLSNLHVASFLSKWILFSTSCLSLMMLSVFLVLLLDLRSAAVCHGLVPQWAHKHVNQKDMRKSFSSVLFFIGLVEGFLFVFVWFLFVFSWVYLRKNKYKKSFRFLKRNVWLLLLKEIHKMKVNSFTFFSSLLSQ